MLKKVFLFFLFIPSILIAQAEYVSADNSVYDFLNRMETLLLIQNYNPFELSKTRKEIGNFLKEVIINKDKLDDADQKTLADLEVEFEYEIYGTLKSYESIIGDNSYTLFNQDQRYLYFYNEPGKANLFINVIGEGESIFRNSPSQDINSSTTLGLVGGEIRGTFLNKFGFFMRGFQGKVFGNKETAKLRNDVRYNFKYNLEPDQGFFDETSGYMSADFDFLKLKLGRDRLKIGHGIVKTLLNDNPPMFDYVSLNLKYKFFSFFYFHGKILGNVVTQFDSVTGETNIVSEKYMGYHRIAFDISPRFSFGAGEIIIYGDRGIDLSYLNPFAFYKSVEHSNQDRDNSMLFFDLNTKPVNGLKIFGTLLIDDITFGKIGTGWYGDQTLIHTGIYSANLYKIAPVDLSLEYVRVEPYTFTHRLIRNNYTSFNYNLGSDLQPNSELFFTQINYRFNNRIRLSASYGFTIHGANPLNPDGSVKENVGGNMDLGHRVNDAESVKFLDGDREYFRNFTASFLYEPFNEMFLIFKLIQLNNSLQNSIQQKETQMFLTLSVKI